MMGILLAIRDNDRLWRWRATALRARLTIDPKYYTVRKKDFDVRGAVRNHHFT